MLARRSLVVGLALIAGACGAAPSAAPRARSRADDAVELAALLPDVVERCVVVRPGAVPDRRRSLVLLPSLAEPSAWAADLHPIAYAMASATGEGGRRAQRSYYRFAGDAQARAREVLPVRWLDEPCDDYQCRLPVARWIDERTLEVARYEWPRVVRGISSGECVQLARERPWAIELAAEQSTSFGMLALPEARRSTWTMRIDRGSLVTMREVELADEVQARILEARLGARSMWIEPALVPLGPSHAVVERHEERVRLIESRLWEELELAVEDHALEQRASSLRQVRSEPVPLSRLRVEDVSAVRHQVSLRRARLPQLAPDARVAAAQELAALLERAWTAHPSELSFARSLARLSLDVLGAPERALAVAERVLAGGIADEPEAWRGLRREALARTSPDALARALVDDGVAANPSESGLAAADLRALVELGVPFEWAEGAWRTSRQLLEGRAPRRAADARVPFEGALGALVAWARIADVERHVTVQIAVRSSVPGEARAIGESRPEVVAVRSADGGTIYVGALASPDLVPLRRLGAALASAIAPGPLELAISLRDPDGAEVLRLRASGTLSGDAFVISRVGPELAGASWPLVTRYLAQPLAEMSTALFPPPTLTIRAESSEMAAELRRHVESTDPGACSAAGPMLRCRRPGRPEELGEVLLRIAAARAREVDPQSAPP